MASHDLETELAVAWHTLTAEAGAAVAELRRALEQERRALETSDVALLDASTQAKLAALHRIEALDTERQQLQQTDRRHLPAQAWRAIGAELGACKRFNATNGAIVDQRISDVRHALAILRGTGDATPELYGAAGTLAALHHQQDFART